LRKKQNYDADVIVVGGGNAGFSAVHSATQRGRKVLLLEAAPENLAGGNSFYTAGATRITHDGLADLQSFIVDDERHDVTEVPAYTKDDYLDDLQKVTMGQTDPELAAVLVEEARPTVEWLTSLGLKYRLMYERQAYENPDGSYLFWGGLHVGNVGGGEGLIADHTRVAIENGAAILYNHRVRRLVVENGKVVGVVAQFEGNDVEFSAESVIMTAGGFEASSELRAKYLGERWASAKVRGTPFNQGDLIEAAVEIGAARGGDYTTCHAIQWDAEHPRNESNIDLTNRLSRQGYPLGILVNKKGERFLDEGEDFRNLTYAKFGRIVLQQPEARAYQIFDAELRPNLSKADYEMPGISVYQGDTLEELAEQLDLDQDAFLATVREYNANINEEAPYDPNVLDGRFSDVTPRKSNWAKALDKAPFYAYPVTCGITFTFGGVKTDTHGRVLNEDNEHIEGLYAAGEMLGGLFSNNYPGGTGLAAGMVFGRRAGKLA
jgi:tricarballylate dehydrogenase